MPRRPHQPAPLERRIINKIIFAVAVIQPLGGVPQVVRLFATRNASSISITSWLIFVLFDLVWLWYGVSNRQKAVMVSAVLFTITEGLVALAGLLFGGSW